MEIPFVDLKQQYLHIKKEVDNSIQKVIDDCAFIGGGVVEDFERDFAGACGAGYCIGVGNGTDAIFIALKSLGIGVGDEVVTVANTYIASAEAIVMTGARPLFVDCDPSTYNMDINKLENLLEEKSRKSPGKVKALVPVHLYGRAVNMGSIKTLAQQYDLKVVEDCAQAHLAEHAGQKVGSIGEAGCFSFYPSKNLGAFGDAGAIITSNKELADKMRMFANHGQVARYDHHCEGINSRLDGLQAAILNVKLKSLADWSKKRYQNALLYHKYLNGTEGVILPQVPHEASHVFHLFVIRVNKRDEVIARLDKMGIPAIVHYPRALPNLEVFKYLGYKPEDFPVASRFQDEILSLPMFPELTDEQIQYICESLKQVVA